jgi:hypothetical protein
MLYLQQPTGRGVVLSKRRLISPWRYKPYHTMIKKKSLSVGLDLALPLLSSSKVPAPRARRSWGICGPLF